ncbi:MAG TPA: ATP-binding cassette domain-containing protein [Solirubrobacter sp.]|nr:ATP-binding cassette domain-containing protein [Solirubrobacter sp.]
MAPWIELTSIVQRSGPRATLDGVTLALAPGRLHGLLGPRWAGKTTLLRVLAGELAPTAGSLHAPDRVLTVEAGGLVLARAIASRPDLLLIDEPAPGFDPQTVATTRALAGRFVAHGGTVLWSARRLESLAGAAATVTVLAAGRVRYSGTVDGLAARALGGACAPLIRAA